MSNGFLISTNSALMALHLLCRLASGVNRPDPGDRAMFLMLPPIGDAQRRPENQLWRDFEIARSHILGACFRALMIDRTGIASEFLRLCAERDRIDISSGAAWEKIRACSPSTAPGADVSADLGHRDRAFS